MPRKAQPRIVRPSGIEQSANGNYFYWKCTISGLETFAPEPRFNDVVKNYGSEEKLFKTYVLRPVKKYIEAGFDAETIKNIANKNNGKLPDLDPSKKAKVVVKPKKEAKNSFDEVAVGTEEVKDASTNKNEPIKVYPWSGNPDFFKGAPSPLSISEVTKETCLYPNRNLDDECRGCPVYSECVCSAKFSEEDWKKPSKRGEVKVTPIRSFDV